MKDLVEPIGGFMSSTTYIQGDCEFPRFKTLSGTIYQESMSGGTNIPDTSFNSEWDYYPPGSVGELMLDYVCDYVD